MVVKQEALFVHFGEEVVPLPYIPPPCCMEWSSDSLVGLSLENNRYLEVVRSFFNACGDSYSNKKVLFLLHTVDNVESLEEDVRVEMWTCCKELLSVWIESSSYSQGGHLFLVVDSPYGFEWIDAVKVLARDYCRLELQVSSQKWNGPSWKCGFTDTYLKYISGEEGAQREIGKFDSAYVSACEYYIPSVMRDMWYIIRHVGVPGSK